MYKLQRYPLSYIYSPHSEEVNDKSEPNRVHKPHPKRWKKKLDCSSSLFGALLGSLIFIIQVVTLCLFYGLKEEDEEERMNVMKFKIIMIIYRMILYLCVRTHLPLFHVFYFSFLEWRWINIDGSKHHHQLYWIHGMCLWHLKDTRTET